MPGKTRAPVPAASTGVQGTSPSLNQGPAATLGNGALVDMLCGHTVQSGETLSGISSQHGLSGWQDLYDANQSTVGDNPDLIFPNQLLNVCTPDQLAEAQEQQAQADMFSRGLDQEGWAGMLDLEGMMDRQRAQQELAGRFDIVADDYAGQRAPNQVTQAEYEEIAQMYSDVRLGRGDLTLDASEMPKAQGDQFRTDVMSDIGSLLTTPSGRDQIRALQNNVQVDDDGNERKFWHGFDVTGSLFDSFGDSRHRHTTISALHQDGNTIGNRGDDGNAPLDNTNAFADRNGNPDAMRNADGSRGLGSDVTIRYNPNTRLDFNSDGNPDTQTTSDIILMHEMAHTRHSTQGTLARGKVTPDTPTWYNSWRQDQVPSTHPDVNTADPTKSVNEREHQAAGLGHFVDPFTGLPDPMTENRYRLERAQLGVTNPNGTPLPQRPNYSSLP